MIPGLCSDGSLRRWRRVASRDALGGGVFLDGQGRERNEPAEEDSCLIHGPAFWSMNLWIRLDAYVY